MNKSRSIAVTVAAMGAAAAAAAAQAPAPAYVAPPDDGRQASALQIIASNDQNGDGIVTKEEATKADKSLILMWGMYDRDQDGRVTPQEIDRASSAMAVATAEEKITGERSSGPAMVKPEQVIRTNDLDGDGFVTKEEATKVGKSLARLWNAYDIDKDGRVDAAEVAKAQNY
jgi:Ca2+-binding EF-hand superfamily protein